MASEQIPADLQARLKALGLFGLIACWEQIADKPWLREVLDIEERERQKRGLERRLRDARVGAFKPMADFDWKWPRKIDREAVDELFTLGFMKTGHNGVLVGPNGIGKTMILKNVAHQALVRGHTARFVTASDMLADLAAQDSSTAVARRLRRYTVPQLLCVDEVGYLSYDNRYADLLFRGSHPSLRHAQGHPAEHQQGLRRVERSLPACRLRRHARRPPHPSRRGDRHRSRQLPPQGGQGAQCGSREAPRQKVSRCLVVPRRVSRSPPSGVS
jgi:hypothetical protein